MVLLMRHDIFRHFDKKDPLNLESHLLSDTPDPEKHTYQSCNNIIIRIVNKEQC